MDAESQSLIAPEGKVIEKHSSSRLRLYAAGACALIVGTTATVTLRRPIAPPSAATDEMVGLMSPPKCSDAGEGCLESNCCNDPSLTCYQKNDHWADCKASCAAGDVDPNSPDEHQSPWSCTVMSDSITDDKSCKCTNPPPPDNLWQVGDDGVVGVCRNGGSMGGEACCDKTHSTECGPAMPPVGTCTCKVDGPDGAWSVGSPGQMAVCSDGMPGCCFGEDSVPCDKATPVNPTLPPLVGSCTCKVDGPDGAWSVGSPGQMAVCSDGKPGCCFGEDSVPCDKATPVNPTLPPQGECSEAGDGCQDTGCCNDKSLKCYRKNDHWADCRAWCNEGQVDWNSPEEDRSPWSCEVLTEGDSITDDKSCKCTNPPPPDNLWQVGDEGVVGVCRNGGSTGGEACCDKTQSTECGPKPAMPPLGTCTCKVVGPAGAWSVGSPGQMAVCSDGKPGCCFGEDSVACDKATPVNPTLPPQGECSEAGDGCQDTGCCNDNSLKCYRKNDHWADCKAWCNEGEVDWNSDEEDRSAWTCEVVIVGEIPIGSTTPGPDVITCDATASPAQMCPGDIPCPPCKVANGICPCPPAAVPY